MLYRNLTRSETCLCQKPLNTLPFRLKRQEIFIEQKFRKTPKHFYPLKEVEVDSVDYKFSVIDHSKIKKQCHYKGKCRTSYTYMGGNSIVCFSKGKKIKGTVLSG